MNHLSELRPPLKRTALARPFKLALVLTLALFAAACGPGSGGSGVGPITGVYRTGGVAVGSASVVSGLDAMSVASTSAFLLTFASTEIRVEGVCWSFSYQGAWGETDGIVRVNGFYRSGPAGTDLSKVAASPATLLARPDLSGLFITLLDAQGATLASFAPAERLPDGVTPVHPAACTSIKLLGAMPPG